MKQIIEDNYTITLDKSGNSLKLNGESTVIILRNTSIMKVKVKELKRKDLLASEFDKDTYSIPYNNLSFFWRYLDKQKTNQVRPRKYRRPKVRYKRTRFSRIYLNIEHVNMERYISWFQENIDRGIYSKPACLNIVHRLKKLCQYNWNNISIEKS